MREGGRVRVAGDGAVLRAPARVSFGRACVAPRHLLASEIAVPEMTGERAEADGRVDWSLRAGLTAVFRRLSEQVDRLIPDDLISQGGEALVRARVVLLVPLPFVVAAVPASIEYYLGGAPEAAVVIVAAVCIALLSPFLLRFGTAPVANVQLALFTTVMAALAWISGGLGSPPLYAYLLTPIIAVALLGVGPAIAWALIGCSVMMGFLALEIFGGAPAPLVSPDALRRGHGVLGLVGIGITLGFTALYDAQRGRVVAELERARAEADAANRAKTAFLANASHELRTPMNGVLGMSSLLQLSGLEPRHSEMVDVIEESAKSLLAVVDDILDYAQLESGSLRLTEAPFDIRELIAATVSMMASLADDKGLRLIAEIDSDVPPRLQGDGTRIRQVLVNLLGNAIKFTGQGEVRLHVSAETESPLSTLTVRVEDTGPGIPAAEHTRIFDRFERLDSSNSRLHPGSGLGLSICRGLLDLLGGDVSLESTVGTGSCFQIRVPLTVCGEPEPAAVMPIGGPSLPASLRILVVEDNAVNQQVVRRMLEVLDCRVDIASDGRKGLAMLEAESFDVVLMDCHMPEMDGFEATRAIRASRDFGDITIVGLTASVTAQDRELCYAAGMDQVLAKPCTIQMLHEALVKLQGSAVRRRGG